PRSTPATCWPTCCAATPPSTSPLELEVLLLDRDRGPERLTAACERRGEPPNVGGTRVGHAELLHLGRHHLELRQHARRVERHEIEQPEIAAVDLVAADPFVVGQE